MISKSIMGNKKKPSLTSKSVTSKALVSSSKTKNQPKSNTLAKVGGGFPYYWTNNNGYHFIKNIKLVDTPGRDHIQNVEGKYSGYIWVSANWVEVHCFYKVTKKSKSEDRYQRADDNGNYEWRNYLINDYKFDSRIISAIVPRRSVQYDNGDIIVLGITHEAVSRWYKWHPEDDYKTTLHEAV